MTTKKLWTILALGGLLASIPAAAASAGASGHHGTRATTLNPPSGQAIRRFCAANMAGFHGGLTEALSLARACDVIVQTPGRFDPYLAAMRAANPQVRILAYLNGTFAQASEGNTYPASWYLQDGHGARVRSRGYGNYVMDPANPAWIADRTTQVQQQIARGYDGTMLDMLGSAPTQPGYMTALPVDPRTGQAYTAAQWLHDTAALAAAVKGSVGSALVTGNGLGSGPRFFNPTSPSSVILAGIDGGVAESWINTTNPQEGPAIALVSAAVAGHATVAMVKPWQTTDPAELDRIHRLSLATYLLGSNSSSFYSFAAANTEAAINGDSPMEHLQLGAPLGPYATSTSGILYRKFANGVVLVNPTTQTLSTNLGTRAYGWRDLSGTTGTTMTLAPQSGDILVGP